MRIAPSLSVIALFAVGCTRGPEGSGQPDPSTLEPEPAAPVAQHAPTTPTKRAVPPGTVPAGMQRGTPGEPLPPMRPAAGGIAWSVEPPLVARRPSSQMREAEYGIEGQPPDAQLAVFYFGEGQGGSVQDNIDRWVSQFHQPDGSESRAAANITTRTVAGMRVTLIDLTGTFGGGMPGAPPGQSPPPKPNYRLLGAIAEGPRGPVFFKMTGPADAVASAESAFGNLVSSFEAVQGN